MSDRETQALERRGAAGDVEAEAAALRARLRAGELSSEQIALAAYCGHPAARLLDPTRPPAHFSTWAYGLGQHPLALELGLRTLYACRPCPEDEDPVPDASDEALRAWATNHYSADDDDALARALRDPRPVNFATAASRLAEALAEPRRPAHKPSWRARLWNAIGYAQPSQDEALRFQRAQGAADTPPADLRQAEARLREALAATLIPAALGAPSPTS